MKLRRLFLPMCCCLAVSVFASPVLYARSPYEGHFSNASTYRMSILDVALQHDGSLLIGKHGRKPAPEAGPGSKPAFVWQTLIKVPKEESARWIEVLRSFNWNSLKLVVPEKAGEKPYLIIMKSM